MTSVSGIDLACAFYKEAVRPIVDQTVPGLRYSAVRIGRGSEVLGYDDEVSQDHDWGPRLEIFLGAVDHERHAPRLLDALAERLPRTFGGHPTSFTLDADGVGVLTETAPGESVAHRVEVHELGQWCESMLGFDPRTGITSFDWLAVSSHRLAEVTGGAVFHDGLGELGPLREALAYYPQPIWVFVLASQWTRISQEEAFVGRCAEVGDELGSTIITARLVRDVMRLCLTMERQYIPYTKWLGSAFARLDIAEGMTPHLSAAIQTGDGDVRQRELGAAYELAAERFNGLKLTDVIDTRLRPFWERGFPVILADRFAIALRRQLRDTDVAEHPFVGSVDQWIDSTDVLATAHRARAAAQGLLQLEDSSTLPPLVAE